MLLSKRAVTPRPRIAAQCRQRARPSPWRCAGGGHLHRFVRCNSEPWRLRDNHGAANWGCVSLGPT